MKFTTSTLFLTFAVFFQTAYADSFYTLQFRAAPAQHETLHKYLSLPVAHRENFGDGQDYIYLGYFNTEKDAQTTLDKLHTQQPELNTYQPIIVELLSNRQTPEYTNRKEKLASVDKNKKMSSINAVEAVENEKNHQPANIQNGPIYTVALAAFEHKERLISFISKYSSNNLYCRQKNNGLYAVYWGIFNSHEHAKQGRDIAKKIPDIQPYIVKFNDNDLNNCNTYKSAAVPSR